MSHTPLIAPAVVSRLHELVSELDDLEVQCGFLADYAEPGLLLGLLRTLQEDVAEYSGSLSAIRSMVVRSLPSLPDAWSFSPTENSNRSSLVATRPAASRWPRAWENRPR